MWNGLWSGRERRAFRRENTSVRVEIGVEIYGFVGRATPFFASGVTEDISCGGLRARLDAPVHRGSLCSVFFNDSSEAVRPCRASGRVVRCDEADGTFRVAVEFDEPLLSLDTKVNALEPAER